MKARTVFAAVALLGAAGCGPFVCNTGPRRVPTPVPADAATTPPAASAARAPIVGKDHPAKDREWPLASAPKAVVSVIVTERRAFASAEELKALYATPIDVDADGLAEWLVGADGEFPTVNTPLWVFAERGGRWSSLGFLGAGYAVEKARGTRPDGYATLCLLERDGPDHFATELAWEGALYRPLARYTPRPNGSRPCEGGR